MESKVTFFGGPLDGHVITRPKGSKWGAYRTVEGDVMGTPEGDRILRSGEGCCYVLYVRRHKQRVERWYVWSPLITCVSRRYGLRISLRYGDSRIPMLRDLYEIVTGVRELDRILALAD